MDIVQWLKAKFAKVAQEADTPNGLPNSLHPYAQAIAATQRPIIAATVGETAPVAPDSSQLGGRPWWPDGQDAPTDQNGKLLFLLAQINFKDLPRLEPLPEVGLVQFFISSDDLMGVDFDDPRARKGFDCVYHTETDGPQSSVFESVNFSDDDISPLEEPLRARSLSFSAESMPVHLSDYRFAKLLPALDAAMESDYDLMDTYAEWSQPAPIRLGGYSSFTQQDPRAYRIGRSLGDFNLLTLESTTGLMWGDVGIAQFLIDEADLRRRDFSRVAYNWDCH